MPGAIVNQRWLVFGGAIMSVGFASPYCGRARLFTLSHPT